MKKSLVALLAVEFIAAAVIGQCGILHRREMDAAYSQWSQQPTSENLAALKQQKRITEFERIGFSGVLFALMGGITVGLYRVASRKQDEVAKSA